MLPQTPPAVYKCILPVKPSRPTFSAIYHSLFGRSRKTTKTLPFPAWPEIQDSHQRLCLPTLMRAEYVEYRQPLVETEEVLQRVEEYLSRSEVIESEMREEVIAFAKSLYISGMNPHEAAFDFARKLGSSLNRVDEVIQQAIAYGGLENYCDEEEVFSAAHELAHRQAILCHSGVVLDKGARIAHKILQALATERLSGEGIVERWEVFVQTNNQLVFLTQKFEPIEEIYATYVGMRYLPISVRNIVGASVKEALNAKGWDTAYEAFVEACENDQIPNVHLSSLFIYETACRLLQQMNIDGAELLYKFLEIGKIMPKYIKMTTDEDDVEIEVDKKFYSILEQAGIPSETFMSILEPENMINPQLMRFLEIVNNGTPYSGDEEQTLLVYPRVVLYGHPAKKEITLGRSQVTKEDKEDEFNLRPIDRVFYEALRQQLSQRCGIFCPFAHKNEACCGRKDWLLMLYERLPAEDRNNFKPPNCDLIR